MTRHRQLLCLALLAACALSACNNRYQAFPRAVTFAGVEQSVARSAAHWNLMAANEAALITGAFESPPKPVPGTGRRHHQPVRTGLPPAVVGAAGRQWRQCHA